METEQQKNCIYCHGDPAMIMDSEYEGVAVWVSGNSLMALVDDACGVYINYCPKCGRKLVEAQHD